MPRGLRVNVLTTPDGYNLLRRTHALRKELGEPSARVVEAVYRAGWAAAVREAERQGIDWRAWLREWSGHGPTAPAVRGPDAPPPSPVGDPGRESRGE